MYLMGVKPWESAKWVVPSLEEMSGKMREKLEAGNPELRVQREGDGVGAEGGARAEEREGSEEALREKKEGEA